MCQSRLDTVSSRMEDQYAIIISDVLRLYGVSEQKIKGAILSSVVLSVTVQIRKAVKKLLNIDLMVVGPGLKTGLNIKIDDPSSLGSDLACGAVAAKHLYPLPCIIIDLGTATKLFALDKDGAMRGGVILPGINISLESLSEKTAALPLISPEPVDKLIGTNTIDSMRSGILNGTACMLDGLIERFEEEIGPSYVCATGGYSSLIRPYCKKEFTVNQELVLTGLRVIYEKNVKNA